MSSDETPQKPRKSDAEVLEVMRKTKNWPPSAQILGISVVEVDQESGRLVAEFDAKPDFCNPLGIIQGGFLTAMLDETISLTGVTYSGRTSTVPTLEMKVSFLKAVKPGKIRAEGRVVRFGKTVAFLEGSLFSQEGELVATASSTAKVVPFPKK